MKMKILAAVALMACGIMGCSKNTQTYEEAIESLLSQKYGKVFRVGQVEEINYHMPVTPHEYKSEVEDVETGKMFSAIVTKDKKELRDDYSKIIFDTYIQEKVENVIENHSQVNVDNWYYSYRITKGKWNSLDQLDDYLLNSESEVRIDCFVAGIDLFEKSKYLYEFCLDLSNQNFKYAVGIELENGKVFIGGSGDIILSQEKIYKSLGGE